MTVCCRRIQVYVFKYTLPKVDFGLLTAEINTIQQARGLFKQYLSAVHSGWNTEENKSEKMIII